VPMAGLIDKKAEIARLAKEIERLRGEVLRADGKLKNPAFVDKAPTDVVAQARGKLDEQRAALARLEDQVEKIKVL
jgi:valyl-tRNA synthetase